MRWQRRRLQTVCQRHGCRNIGAPSHGDPASSCPERNGRANSGRANSGRNRPAHGRTTQPPPGGGGGPPASSQATVIAQTLDFVNKSVTAKAGTVTLVLQNKDLLVAHNVTRQRFRHHAGLHRPLRDQPTFTAGPGTYRFSCTIHTDMVGSLTLVP